MNPVLDAVPFRRAILAWYRKHGRDLPWRRTNDPYAILVSEFMLQQTQVATVLSYYDEWMRRFPDFASLAGASEQEILHAWQGLGYYARARNLHATARLVMERHGGHFPRSLDAIRDLAGIGRYTANAVATFAFGQSVPVVEANIARLLARLLNLQIPINTGAGRHALWNAAGTLVPNRAASVYNSALMDLGALICGKRPRCPICPIKNFCLARDPAKLPLKKSRPAIKLRTEYHSFAICRRRVLLEQSQDRWRGMWMLPRLAKPPPSEPLHVSEFPFTNHRITLTVFSEPETTHRKQPFQKWFPLNTLDSVPLPSPHRRALAALIKQA